jgi:heme oxygenase (biliverdin-IX-beta and delta-forming)
LYRRPLHKPVLITNLKRSVAGAASRIGYPRCVPIHPNPLAGIAASPGSGGARARLRQATADLHGRVDAMFPDGLDSLHAYRRYVLGMHRFTADYEIATATQPRASSWLAHDLVALSQPPLPAAGVRVSVADRAERLGWDYVMAGSSLGARVLLREAGHLGFDAAHGAAFLARHAAGADWAVVQSRLAELDVDDARCMALAEAGAREAFALVRTCLERGSEALSLYPDETAI